MMNQLSSTMNAQTSTITGCGSQQCECAGLAATPEAVEPSINGVRLLRPGEQLPPEALKERAFSELLRQQAVHAGLLPGHEDAVAPELDAAQQAVIEQMVDAAIVTPQPQEEECRRYYEANKTQFVLGQALHVRHILFAVTPGVNVHALIVHAEKALMSLLRKDAPAGHFEQLANELSNCPSSAQGGDLGWIGPQDCAPELANELFHQKQAGWGMGVHPRLVHTRFGFHIVEVLNRRKGRQQPFEAVRESIATHLSLQSRNRALYQYMNVLAGEARVEGITLDSARSPLVQ